MVPVFIQAQSSYKPGDIVANIPIGKILNHTATSSSPSPTAKRITPVDLAKLRWIEGSWR